MTKFVIREKDLEKVHLPAGFVIKKPSVQELEEEIKELEHKLKIPPSNGELIETAMMAKVHPYYETRMKIVNLKRNIKNLRS